MVYDRWRRASRLASHCPLIAPAEMIARSCLGYSIGAPLRSIRRYGLQETILTFFERT